MHPGKTKFYDNFYNGLKASNENRLVELYPGKHFSFPSDKDFCSRCGKEITKDMQPYPDLEAHLEGLRYSNMCGECYNKQPKNKETFHEMLKEEYPAIDLSKTFNCSYDDIEHKIVLNFGIHEWKVSCSIKNYEKFVQKFFANTTNKWVL